MSPARQASIGLRVASLLFASVCIAHAAALWLGLIVQIGELRVGLGARVAVIFVTAALSFWMRKLAVALEKPPAPPVG